MVSSRSSLSMVSVIIPVYNVQEYISDCIDSVMNQTLVPYEIILVDDGSTDDSGVICDKYANQYSTIVKVIHKKNEGLNFARRDGFQKAIGDYIAFVDSDDILSKDFIDILQEAIVSTSADMAIGGYQNFYDVHDFSMTDKENINRVYEKQKKNILEWLITGNTPWNDRIFIMTAWGKLYRRKLIEGIDWNFSNYRANEDELWSMQVFNNIENGAAVVEATIYGYRQNQNSITRKRYKNEYGGRTLDKFEFINELYQKSLEYLGQEYSTSLLRRFTIQTIVFLDRYSQDRMLSFSNIISARRVLYPKLGDIMKLPLSEDSISLKIRFINKYGIWLYVAFSRLRFMSKS